MMHSRSRDLKCSFPFTSDRSSAYMNTPQYQHSSQHFMSTRSSADSNSAKNFGTRDFPPESLILEILSFACVPHSWESPSKCSTEDLYPGSALCIGCIAISSRETSTCQPATRIAPESHVVVIFLVVVVVVGAAEESREGEYLCIGTRENVRSAQPGTDPSGLQ